MTTDECIALSDDDLVHAAYEAAVEVLEVDDALGERMFELVGELAERFAPEAAGSWLAELYADDPPDERLDALEGLRRRQAARLLRAAPATDSRPTAAPKLPRFTQPTSFGF
jgi:hypothetical protein